MKNRAEIVHARDVLGKPFSSNLLPLIGQGIIVGLVTGLIVSAFRWLIDHTLTFLQFIYPLMRSHWLLLIPYVFVTLVIVFLLGQILRGHVTDLVGSGVPQIEAIMLGQHSMKPLDILWRKFVGGLLAICPGLFLGREGPCIQMGACVGQEVANLCHITGEERHYLLGCGVAAGLAAAFSAPLAGVLFLLEEITFNFKARTWIAALVAASAADLVTLLFFGTKPCLYLPLATNLPESSYLWLIPLGILIGILAFGYQYTLLSLRAIYGHLHRLPKIYQSIIPLLLVIPVGLWNDQILGGSHVFINQVTQLAPGIQALGLLVIFFVVRFVFSMISYGASVPGGIFMPILTLGALLGAIIAVIMIHQNLILAACFLNIIVITMAAYFGAIEEAPFTAITLLCEMVGTVDQALPMVILTFVAFVTSNMLGGQPIYTALRHEMKF